MVLAQMNAVEWGDNWWQSCEFKQEFTERFHRLLFVLLFAGPKHVPMSTLTINV
jgi:hypothetical protein